MFVSFSVSYALLISPKRSYSFGYWGVLACKDFKSWESIYGREVKITFEQEKGEQAPQVLKDLQTHKLTELRFVKRPIVTDDDKNVLLKNSILHILLDPNTGAVSLELESKDNMYYHKVTIHYKRIVSLISTEDEGLQIQYVIKRIQLRTKDYKKAI